MMEGSDNLILRLALCLLALLGSGSCAQEDFVSIRCCAESNSTHTETTISWEPDKSWFPDRTDCRKISRPIANYTGYDRARTFDINSGKICYNLSTVKDQDYLIRGTFLFGDLLEATFDVTIGVTKISSVSSVGDLVVEGIFRATDQETDFCLVKGKGSPYISELELRPLNDSGYLNNQSLNVLKVVHRVSLGSKTYIRYPIDLNDRIWEPPLNLDPTAVLIPYNNSQPIPYIQNASQTVPFQVLQTALTEPDRLDFTHVDLDSGYHNYTVFLYFLELNSSVTRGKRVFDIRINNFTKIENFDVLDGGSNYRKVSLNVRANGSLNLTLVKATNGSDLGPMISAYEILQVHQTAPETNQEDVKLMKEARDGFLASNPYNIVLQSWFGDPCGPVSWEGLACETINHNISIINLNISSKNLTGPVPTSITKLSNLKHLNLSHNDFTGQIPPFPASSMLISIDLSHNDFTGTLPESLINLRQLRALYYGCNPNLSKQDHPLDRPKITTDNGSCNGWKKSKKTNSVQGLIIGAVVCVSFLFMVAAGALSACFYRIKFMDRTRFKRKGYPITKNAVFSISSNDDVEMKSINIQAYTLDYLEAVTHTYKTMIGEGGFGSVYRGTLLDGQEVAVKVRSATSTQGTREFNNELDLLSAIRHENLVPLLGYCSDNDQQILVYPFMSNGSLQDRLYGDASKRKILDWPTRLSIALGAARGLTYLHSFAGRCIIHRDVKSSNILLDNSMCAKVADFGFSKYAPQEGDSCASLEVRGTAGYLDPEYYSTQHLSAKSDVFSFGVVLLEIISGREPLNIHRPRNEWSLVEWAKPFIRESKIDEIVDPNIKGGYHTEAVWRVVEVAMACIEPFSAYRPCMVDIVRELEDALIIENNASEYMKSIDSFGGSNRFSIVIEKKCVLLPPPPTQHPSPSEPSPLNPQPLAPPDPR